MALIGCPVNVGQFGTTDKDLDRYKQAGEYALEAKMYRDDSLTIYNELKSDDIQEKIARAEDAANRAETAEIHVADMTATVEADFNIIDGWVKDMSVTPYGFTAAGGEVTVTLPSNFTKVSSIYINGGRQEAGDDFTYNATTHVVTFAYALQPGDRVSVLAGTLYEQTSTLAQILQGLGGADYVKTGDGTSVQQRLNKLDKSIPFVTPEMFGATSDGVDSGAAIAKAWDFVCTNGGELRFGVGVYNMGTTRIKIQYSPSLRPHTIKGVGDSTVLSFEDIPPSGLGPTQNWVKEEPLIQYLGTSGSQYIPQVKIDNLTIDYSKQSNKGGTSLSTLNVTHPTPYSLGVWAIYFFYALRPKVSNVKFNEIYGDGVIMRKSTFPTVTDCYFYNVSAGNILTRYAPQNMASDSNGGCIFLWACHGGLVENNLCWNTRNYLADVTSIDNGTQIKNTLCGYIGIWAEYGYAQNMTSTGGESAPPLVSGYVSYDSVNTDNWNSESLGAVIRNNTVYGYTIGIKSEGLNETLMTQNVALNCYITIFAASTRSVISENWTDMLYCDNRACPQGGYQTIRGHIVCHNYSTIFDGARIGVTIRDNKCYATNFTALRLNRTAATISGNMFRFTRGTGSLFDISISSLVFGTIIKDNLFFIDSTVASVGASNLQYHDNIVFSGNRFINRSGKQSIMAFRNTCKDIIIKDNHFDGAFYLAVQCTGKIEGNVFDCWTPVNSVYYSDKLFENSGSCNVTRNTFRINSGISSGQIVVGSSYSIFEGNLIDVQDTGATTALAWVYAIASSNGLVFKDNRILSNKNNIPMFYTFNLHFPRIEGNVTDDALIVRGGTLYAPITIGINKCSSLFSSSISEFNTAANVSPNITPYVGMKMNYLLPAPSGAEGLVYTASGWKTFGSISA